MIRPKAPSARGGCRAQCSQGAGRITITLSKAGTAADNLKGAIRWAKPPKTDRARRGRHRSGPALAPEIGAFKEPTSECSDVGGLLQVRREASHDSSFFVRNLWSYAAGDRTSTKDSTQMRNTFLSAAAAAVLLSMFSFSAQALRPRQLRRIWQSRCDAGRGRVRNWLPPRSSGRLPA
jgi:hypothetical protein